MANSARRLGPEGESLAAVILQKKGMRLIGRNIRSKTGEIDLVFLDEGALVFVEVKNWPAYGLENLAYGINKKKQYRIIETAKYFLATHREYNYRSIRFDVVLLRSGEPVHLISAFTESL
ncbi:UPF0102 protein [Spirochaetia bacterium]|nr:UPF0102 protein [Spirochaetia bacterium]